MPEERLSSPATWLNDVEFSDISLHLESGLNSACAKQTNKRNFVVHIRTHTHIAKVDQETSGGGVAENTAKR